MKVTYIGTDERVFPTLGLVVKPNESFEVPADFNSALVTTGAVKQPTPTAPITTSAASDSTVGE